MLYNQEIDQETMISFLLYTIICFNLTVSNSSFLDTAKTDKKQQKQRKPYVLTAYNISLRLICVSYQGLLYADEVLFKLPTTRGKKK